MQTSNPEQNSRIKSAGMGFFWLNAFYLVYCARPADWFGPIGIVPLAKITGIAAFLAFLFSSGKGKRKFRALPIEPYFLLVMMAILLVSSVFSPFWKEAAISRTMDFTKVLA